MTVAYSSAMSAVNDELALDRQTMQLIVRGKSRRVVNWPCMLHGGQSLYMEHMSDTSA